jgi:hypothetical protein
VTSVNYFAGSKEIGGASLPPYLFTWNAVPPEYYILYAKATLADGTSEISNMKQIHVLSPNIAANDPCEYSTAQNPAQNAFDGDFTTRWTSTRSDPQWISVDLRNRYRIDGVTLFWGTSYASDYSIDVSLDTLIWTTVFATSTSHGGADYLTFPPVEARYVRMFGNRRGTPYEYSLWEFQVHGENATDVQPAKKPESPRGYELSQNYPNPFNASTSFSFDLPTESWVSLKVYDLHGREAAVLVSEKMPAGNHVRRWDAGNFPGGVYCYRLRAGSFDQSGKLILLK